MCLQGEEAMTAEVDNMYNAILDNRLPASWKVIIFKLFTFHDKQTKLKLKQTKPKLKLKLISGVQRSREQGAGPLGGGSGTEDPVYTVLDRSVH